jgi:hypothetical protein
MRYLANLRAVLGVIVTRFGLAGAVQHITRSGIMPANSAFARAFTAHIQ